MWLVVSINLLNKKKCLFNDSPQCNIDKGFVNESITNDYNDTEYVVP